jgi:serine/threonine protein kinase/WD40 repeat protein
MPEHGPSESPPRGVQAPNKLPVPPAPPPPRIVQKPKLDQALKLWGAAGLENTPPGATLKIARPPGPELKTPSKLPDRIFSLNYQPKATQADYLVNEPLGEGGMGIVYAAIQRCLNRPVAVKTIKPGTAAEDSSKKQFLSEALITGKLDHPNVVPVHEMGANGEGLLFYSMKRVQGTPWSHVIREKTLEDNLDILLRVADAIAFAHDQNILHCDLKPENVMLGDYGEVYVMDWGLALSTRDLAEDRSSGHATILGGTPAYMPPEFAHNDTEKTGPASDIYLLGALLYEILTGRPPHTGKSLSEVLASASANTIPPVFGHAELAGIALKCMATEPAERYATAKDLQQDIRTFRTHLDSLTLADTARHGLEQAEQSGDYRDYSRSLHGFEQALNLWRDNPSAQTGLAEARDRYAKRALSRTDLELAESLLDRGNPAHQTLLRSLDRQRRERDHRRQILRRMKWGIGILTATTLLTLSIAQLWIRSQRNAAREEAYITGTRLAQTRLLEGDWQEVRAIRRALAVENAEWEWEWLNHNSHFQGVVPGSKPKKQEAVELARNSPDGSVQVLLRVDRRCQVFFSGRSTGWNASDGVQDFRIRGGGPQAIALFWDGTRLLGLKAWSGRTVSEVPVSSDPLPGSLSPDGSRLLLLPEAGPPAVHDTATGRLLATLIPPPDQARALTGCLSPDNKRAAILFEPNLQIVLFDAETGRAVFSGPARPEMRGEPAQKLEYMPDNSALLNSGFSKGVAVLDPQVLTPRQILPLPSHPTGFATSPDGRLLAAADGQGNIRILDLASNRIIWNAQLGSEALTALLFNADASILRASDASGRQYRLPPDQRKPWRTLQQNPYPALRLLPDTATHSVYSADQAGQLWKLNPASSGSEPEWLADGLVPRCGIAFLSISEGRRLVYATHENLMALDPVTHRASVWMTRPGIRHLSASPDGKHLALCFGDQLEIHDAAGQGKRVSLSTRGTRITETAWAPDSSWIAIGRVDGVLQVLDPRHPAKHLLETPPGKSITALAPSPDGRWLAASTTDRQIRIWDLGSGCLLQSRNDFDDVVLDLDFSPDMRRLFCACADGKIHIFDTATFRRILDIPLHRGPAVQISVSPGGSTVYTSGTDGVTRACVGTRTAEEWDAD